MSGRLLFLDVDGVLLPFGAAEYSAEALEALRTIVAASQARIVLSSSWRASYSALEELSRRIAPLEIDDTTDKSIHEPRQWEIARYLAKLRGETPSWVAIDDENLVDGKENLQRASLFRERSVLVDSRIGLTRHHVAEVLEKLLR